MKTRERGHLSTRSTESRRRREKDESSDSDMEELKSRSREVSRNKKGSHSVETSEESSKSDQRRFARPSTRILRRAKTEIEETTEEVIEAEEIISRTMNDVSRSSTSTSRKQTERLVRNKGKARNTEVPITDMLKKALDKEHTNYYTEAVTPSTLTTDKIYIQGKNGFSAVRIPTVSEEDQRCSSTCISKDVDVLRGRSTLTTTTLAKGIYAPINVAILAQKCWKRTALFYQGLLAGMALTHLAMVRVFFDTSMEFIGRYSFFSEIYSSLFSLLIVLSVISIFDKFDLAHLEMDRLHDVRGNYVGSAVAIPLYVATLCLHESFANVDDQLALIHYRRFNDSLWYNNTTSMEDFLDGLTTWQRVNVSKDLLAALSWLLVVIGTQDDALLLNLESMQEYGNDLGN